MSRPPGMLRRALSRARPRAASIRSRQFWLTQLLVLATVGAIYLTDLASFRTASGTDTARFIVALRNVISAFALVPALYAALAFGLEGAVLTTLWVALLAGPHVLVAANGDHSWVIEPVIFLTVLATGTVLAVRVEAEREARRRAEALSRRLTLLHELGLSLGRAGAIPDLLENFVRTVHQGLDVGYASISYQEEPGDVPLLVHSGDPALAEWLASADVRGSGAPAGARNVDTCVVPLTAEHSSFGVLGVAREGRPLSHDTREVLAIASLEASALLEVRHLEKRRREALMLYARQVTNAQEEERARIARELHDGPVQVLSGLARALDLLQQQWGADNAALSTSVEQLREVSSEALAGLRQVTRDLRPTTLDRLGLLAALRSLVGELAARSSMRVDLHFGDPGPLPAEIELCIFRVVQEALTNVEKHARASQVAVTLSFAADEVQVEIRDNGIGGALPPDLSELARGGRFGLLGMTERAVLVGGRINVSALPEGTTVALRIPAHWRRDVPGEKPPPSEPRRLPARR